MSGTRISIASLFAAALSAQTLYLPLEEGNLWLYHGRGSPWARARAAAASITAGTVCSRTTSSSANRSGSTTGSCATNCVLFGFGRAHYDGIVTRAGCSGHAKGARMKKLTAAALGAARASASAPPPVPRPGMGLPLGLRPRPGGRHGARGES